MRFHLLFPLAFLSGIYGFLIFVPYLIAITVLGHILRARRDAARHLVTVKVSSTEVAPVQFGGRALVPVA